MTPAQAKGISLRFKIRCSAIGKIMTNGRGKDEMGETAKTYALNWILEQPEFLNMPVNTFDSKQTRKGNAVEAAAIDLIGEYLYDGEFLTPNKQHLNNYHCTGTPDILRPDHIIDNKCTWSAKSFPFFKSAPDSDYWWQGQGYMWLTGLRKYKVIHTLMDTPEPLIKREIWSVTNDMGLDEPTDEIEAEVRARLTFSHLPIERRVKVFNFEYDECAIDRLTKRVEDVREFIYTTLLTINEQQNKTPKAAELF
jgi:hypothetical protein